ncbi:MAG: metal-dependent hydrolase [Methylococcaceae bacterium]|nr:metal-dependent hydrolase [Methylococcaceae bacterium]
MANFNTHLAIAATVSTGAALLAAKTHILGKTDLPWFIFLGTLGGLLPDIDANHSKPVKLLFNVLALIGVAAILQAFSHSYPPYPLALSVIGTYLSIRHVAYNLFNQFTLHRGVFHSLLASVFFALLTTNICHRLLHWDVQLAWLNGLFIALGYCVHLLLDEAYSVDLSNAKIKKSFGSAFKLISYNNLTASVLMALCTLALYWLTPPPTPLLKAWKNIHWQHTLSIKRP